MSEIVFLTLFLGLATGPQPVELQVSPAIRTISITLDGRKIAELKHKPWTASVDLGSDLIPRSLEAVGYDEKSNEVARARQILNLPRPVAEVTIVPKWEHDKPVGVDLRWTHRHQLVPNDVRARATPNCGFEPIATARQ